VEARVRYIVTTSPPATTPPSIPKPPQLGQLVEARVRYIDTTNGRFAKLDILPNEIEGLLDWCAAASLDWARTGPGAGLSLRKYAPQQHLPVPPRPASRAPAAAAPPLPPLAAPSPPRAARTSGSSAAAARWRSARWVPRLALLTRCVPARCMLPYPPQPRPSSPPHSLPLNRARPAP
jgi:hypothetical protein